MSPAIHKAVVSEYNGSLPHDDILRQYLVWDRPAGSRFNEDVVDTFIERFRHTLAYAGVELNSETADGQDGHLVGDSDNSVDPRKSRREVKVGSLVQWASNGADQFDQPRKVLGIDESGEWAFVEGSNTGVPMSELCVLEPEKKDEPRQPPKNPFPRVDSSSQSQFEQSIGGQSVERTDLDEGDVVLTLPKKLSSESVQDFEYWVMGVIRKLKRRSVVEADE